MMGVFDFVGTIGSGFWLSDRFDNRWPDCSGTTDCAGFRCCICPFTDFSLLRPLSLFAVFYGLDWIVTVPPTVKLTADRFGRERAGMVFGWVFAGHHDRRRDGRLRCRLFAHRVCELPAGVLCRWRHVHHRRGAGDADHRQTIVDRSSARQHRNRRVAESSSHAPRCRIHERLAQAKSVRGAVTGGSRNARSVVVAMSRPGRDAAGRGDLDRARDRCAARQQAYGRLRAARPRSYHRNLRSYRARRSAIRQKRYAGNNLRLRQFVTLEAGTKRSGLPIFGLYNDFPKYSARAERRDERRRSGELLPDPEYEWPRDAGRSAGAAGLRRLYQIPVDWRAAGPTHPWARRRQYS